MATIRPIFIKPSGVINNIIFKINNSTYDINNSIENIEISFNDLELEIGKKICQYEIIEKMDKKEAIYKGLVEINLGQSDAYIFLNNKGISFEFIFWKGIHEIKSFINKKFEIEYLEKDKTHKSLPITLNRLNTEDRANLILINCPINASLKADGNILLNIETLSKKIGKFSADNSYVLCFHKENYHEFEYKKVNKLEELNFKDIYKKYKQNVKSNYNNIHKAIKENNIDLKAKIEALYDEELEGIFKKKKFILPKKILIQELNEKEYVEFYYNFIYFYCIYKKINCSYSELNNLSKILEQNYEKIDKDKELQIYEKILILNNILYSDILERDKIVNYYKIDQLNKNSPLFLSIEFLKKFIDTFDYNSTFYYPLMCIDSGVFRIVCKKGKIYELSTYGLNMFSIDLIRKHLYNLIPNIIIISKNMDNTYYCDTYEGIGLVTLNGNSFGDDIIKEIGDKNDRNHKAFVLSKNIFHESFGHNKSCFSKDSNLYNSPKCFKDKNGQLR